MPLQEIQHTPQQATIGIWHITETLETLRQQLAPVYRLDQITSHRKRQKEWVAIRLLLQILLPENRAKITYDQFGKPMLSDNSYQISISHSATHATLILHPTTDVGIDIEVIRPKIERLQYKFLGQRELQDLVNVHPENRHERLTILWTAKESLYKLYGKKRLRFIEHLPIHQDQPNESTPLQGTLQASICLPNDEKHYTLHYQEVDKQILTYVIGND
ncbi:MAG: 4'-phosphopantetheinyl transferase family protein [Chitinophagales bacterium]